MNSRGPEELHGDALEYHTYAVNLLDTGVYRDNAGNVATRMPGYPLFLAGLYKIFGARVAAAQSGQALLGALTSVFLFLSARRLLPGPWPWVAGLLSVVYYDFFKGTPRLLTETLYVFLLAVFFWMWLSADEKSPGRAFLTGIPLGLAALVRPEAALFAAAAGGLLLWPFRPKSFLSAAAFGLGVFLCLAPWWLRNHRALGVWVSTTSRAGFNAYVGLRIPQENLGFASDARYAPTADDEVERDKLYGRAAEALYEKTPVLHIVRILAYNAAVLLYPFHPAYDPTLVFCLPFWLLGIYALGKRREGLVLILFAGLSAAVYIFFGATVSRYREPLAPALVLLSAVGLHLAWTKGRPPWRGALMGGWAGINAALWAFGPALREALLRGKEFLW